MTKQLEALKQQTLELLIANGYEMANQLRHLSENEIDSDSFAVVTENYNGTEIKFERPITELALQAAGTFDELVAALDQSRKNTEELVIERVELSTALSSTTVRAEKAELRIAELEARPLEVKLPLAAQDVLAERQRQKESKGYTERRDDNYLPGVLNLAGAAYAVSVSAIPDAKRRAQRLWPWPDAGKYLNSSPKEPRAALVKAGALIMAEIERMDRAAGGTVEGE